MQAWQHQLKLSNSFESAAKAAMLLRPPPSTLMEATPPVVELGGAQLIHKTSRACREYEQHLDFLLGSFLHYV